MKNGIECFLIEKLVPILLEDMDNEKALRMRHDTPGIIYKFSKEPGYNLPFELWAYYHLRESEQSDESELSDIIAKGEDKIVRLARQIFTAFPRLVSGFMFHIFLLLA